MPHLLEWLDAQGNKINIKAASTSSSASMPVKNKKTGYKENFQKMLEYHMNMTNTTSANTYIVESEIKLVEDNRFHYQETHKIRSGSYVRDVVGAIQDSSWLVCEYIDGKFDKEYHENSTGFSGLISQLEKNKVFIFPPKNSTEYQEILAESFSFAEDFRLYESLWD